MTRKQNYFGITVATSHLEVDYAHFKGSILTFQRLNMLKRDTEIIQIPDVTF